MGHNPQVPRHRFRDARDTRNYSGKRENFTGGKHEKKGFCGIIALALISGLLVMPTAVITAWMHYS